MKLLIPIFSILLFISLLSMGQASVPEPASEAIEPIKILLVPGHDTTVWGAQYGNVTEGAMNLAVASRVYKLLKDDPRFEVWITRDGSGYTKEFAEYLNGKEAIIAFRDEAKTQMKSQVATGEFTPVKSVPHNAVKPETSIILYGINKWANENTMDAVIHFHFNDFPRKNRWALGKYEGFTVYVPEDQMANAIGSQALGQAFFDILKEKYDTSTNPLEEGGFIKGQKLIALGANGTLISSVRSVLVEYGYVYEKKFRSYTSRHKAYDDLANDTVRALQGYSW